MALTDKLKAIADAVREVTGSTGLLTLDEMAEMITYLNAGTETYDANTYILVDQDGNEIPAVLTDEEVELTATTNDIRIGTTAVTDEGVVTGDKEIPSYYVSEGYRIVTAGSSFVLPTNNFDYDKLQALFCKFNTNLDDSVYTDKIVINNSVYTVLSAEKLSDVTKAGTNAQIDFGIVNNTEHRYILRYFMYREVY